MDVPAPVKKMYDALSCIPPDFAGAEDLLAGYRPTEEELMWLAIKLVDNTFGEYADAQDEERSTVKVGHLHRDFLYQTISFLLEYGLDPNTVIDSDSVNAENVMLVLTFTDGPDVAASVMRLLMERGGDPNLYVGGETPTTYVDCDMCLDPIYTRGYFDNLVQVMMVLQAYGGHWVNNEGKIHTSFEMREGFSSEIFKEFERFDYRFGEEEGYPGYIHVYEKPTGKTVADYI